MVTSRTHKKFNAEIPSIVKLQVGIMKKYYKGEYKHRFFQYWRVTTSKAQTTFQSG